MQPLRLTVLACLTLMAAACAGTTDEFLPVSTSDQTLLVIGRDSAGPINRGTPYSKNHIEKLLPEFTTGTVQTAVEDNTVYTLVAFAQGMQVIHIYKGSNGKVGAVHGVTHHLKGPAGERIGMTFGQVGQKRSHCRVGRNLWRGMAICRSKAADNVQLVFAIPNFEGPFNALPKSKLLKNATLQRIIWTPA
jgi:hypothetical protein